jgi:3'-5' exoribonuclease
MELVPVSPIDVNSVIKPFLNSVIGNMKDADYVNIVKYMIKHVAVKMSTCPAAKSIHHAFIGGEMMHVYNMVRVAKQLIPIYPIVNEDLLFAGIICHDMCKEKEYSMSPVGLLTGTGLPGKMSNHLQMGAEQVAIAGEAVGAPQEKIELLKHLILSHHEKPEWGSPVGPAVAEAWMLCLIDNLDAKMETVTEKLAQMEVGDVVDKAINGLPLYKHWEPQQ